MTPHARIIASRLAYPAVRAALAAAGRNHDLGHDDLDTAEQAWEQYWAAVRPVSSPQPSNATPANGPAPRPCGAPTPCT